MIKRLDSFLAQQGYISRRKVTDFLNQNHVLVNGKRVRQAGKRFNPQKDSLTINGQHIKRPTLEYIIVNKPIGMVSTTQDDHNRRTVLSLINTNNRLYPVGRLDAQSHGLVLLTNDGELTYKLTHPKHHIPKTYIAFIKNVISFRHLNLLRTGVRLKDGKTQPANVEVLNKDEHTTLLQITLYEGRHRQIRRMCKSLNLHLKDLERIQIGPIKLGKLKIGQWRPLKPDEVKSLTALK